MATTHVGTLHDLLDAGEVKRLARSQKVSISEAKVQDTRIVGSVVGSKNIYFTRITLFPKRGFYCSCPDCGQRGRRVGPCKHVLALAQWGLDEIEMDAPETDA